MMQQTQPSDLVTFAIGEEVYHRTAPTEMGLVVGIVFLINGHLVQVQWGRNECSSHYPFELTREKSFVEA